MAREPNRPREFASPIGVPHSRPQQTELVSQFQRPARCFAAHLRASELPEKGLNTRWLAGHQSLARAFAQKHARMHSHMAQLSVWLTSCCWCWLLRLLVLPVNARTPQNLTQEGRAILHWPLASPGAALRGCARKGRLGAVLALRGERQIVTRAVLAWPASRAPPFRRRPSISRPLL